MVFPSERCSLDLWIQKDLVLIGTRTFTAQQLEDYLDVLDAQAEERFKSLHSTQDDAGHVYRAVCATNGLRKPEPRRSSSQPPNVLCSIESNGRHARRMCDCDRDDEDRVERCGLTHGYHYCRIDSRWRLGGRDLHDDGGYPILDQRACLTGDHRDIDILHEIYWDLMREHGFVAKGYATPSPSCKRFQGQ